MSIPQTSLSIQENISLQSFNTLSVPALARWFVEVDDEEQLLQALSFYQQQQCPLLVLGGGSNIVLTKDFMGIVIKNNIQGRFIEKETDDKIFLSVAAGEDWHQTVMYCVENNFYGVENLALIPGSVGAAPIQNIGAYGVELAQCFSYLEAINIDTQETISLTRDECEFAYRDSVFKNQLNHKVIITRVVLELSKQPQWTLNYPALQQALAKYQQSDITAQLIADNVIAIRNSKLPKPSDIPNAGSFFKNPIVDQKTYQRLKEQWPAMVAFAQPDNCYKLAAGWLIDNAGWKGKVVGGVSMHQQQALVLTNPLGLSGAKLLEFIQRLTTDIAQTYGITLEIEPRIF